MKTSTIRNSSRPYLRGLHLVLATIGLTMAASGQNLVTNGNFGSGLSGWTSTPGAPGNSFPGWEHWSGLESNASNLAAPAGFTAAQGAAYNQNDWAAYGTPPYDLLSQSVSGLQSSAAANGGKLIIYFDLFWSNGVPESTSVSSTARMDLLLGNTDLFTARTSSGVGVDASLSHDSSVLLNAGTAPTTFLPGYGWTRYSLTLPNYSGPDTQALSFRFSTESERSGNPNDDYRLDNVFIQRAVAVPEPSSALFVLVAGGLGLMSRRRRA